MALALPLRAQSLAQTWRQENSAGSSSKPAGQVDSVLQLLGVFLEIHQAGLKDKDKAQPTTQCSFL